MTNIVRSGQIGKNRTKTLLALFFLCFASYMVCFLTYFPGVGMNDGLNILKFGMREMRQHPALYVWSLVTSAEKGRMFGVSYDIGYALFVIAQVVIVSAWTAVILLWIVERDFSVILKGISVVYYVFSPLISMYAVSVLKDTLFSLGLVLEMLVLYEWKAKGDSWRDLSDRHFWVAFSLLNVFLICWRNNGKYIVFPLLMVLFLIHKKHRIRIAAVFGAAVLGLLANNVVTHKYEQEQMFQEMAGIPLQQVSAVIANDGEITSEQAAFLSGLMPLEEIKKRYHPQTVDPIKWSESFNNDYLNAHKAEFLKCWWQMFRSNFQIYVKAYLDTTYYFWRPVANRKAQCYFTIESTADNDWLPAFLSANGIRDLHLFPEHLDQELRSYYQQAERFLSEGTLFWIMILSMLVVCVRNRDAGFVCAYLPMLLLWGTVMISTPVAGSLRYVFAFVYALPLFILFAIRQPVKSAAFGGKISDGETGDGKADGDKTSGSKNGGWACLRSLCFAALVVLAVCEGILLSSAGSIDRIVWESDIGVEKHLDLKELAERNHLEYAEDTGIKVKGAEHSLIYGSYEGLHPGKIEVTFSIHADVNADANTDKSGPLFTLRLSEQYGQVVWREVPLKPTTFQRYDTVDINMRYQIDHPVEGAEFLVFAHEDYEADITDIYYSYVDF